MKVLFPLISGKINEGTSHWLMQRASSIILIPLTVIFVFIFAKNFELGYEQNLQLYKTLLDTVQNKHPNTK